MLFGKSGSFSSNSDQFTGDFRTDKIEIKDESRRTFGWGSLADQSLASQEDSLL